MQRNMKKKYVKPRRNDSLKRDLSIDTSFDPSHFLLDSPFNSVKKIAYSVEGIESINKGLLQLNLCEKNLFSPQPGFVHIAYSKTVQET
jgi:hypothetical protein